MYDVRLIDSEVCIRCGGCCSTYVHKGTGEYILARDAAGDPDAELMHCQYLDTSEGLFRCSTYASRSQLCRTWNCLDRGNTQGIKYDEDHVIGSRVIATVQKIHGRSIEIKLDD